jgi:hypothetical protein
MDCAILRSYRVDSICWRFEFRIIIPIISNLAVFCIVYGLICALREDEEEERVRHRSELWPAKKESSVHLCPRHLQQRKKDPQSSSTSLGYVTIEIFKETPGPFNYYKTRSSSSSVFE